MSFLEGTPDRREGGRKEGREETASVPLVEVVIFFVGLGARRVRKGELGRRNLIPYLAKILPSTREEGRVAQPRMWRETKFKLAGRAGQRSVGGLIILAGLKMAHYSRYVKPIKCLVFQSRRDPHQLAYTVCLMLTFLIICTGF